ncbi:hypothetical protein ACFLS1_12765, partial [Verrucomicrobiota bacterium]
LTLGMEIMTTQELSKAMCERLHPEPYGRMIKPSGIFDFLLMRRSALPGGRYAFAFGEMKSDNISEAYSQARAEAHRLTKSMWMLREVGLYLMFSGSESLWQSQIDQAPVDKTGFHSIIVQTVHFIDPATGVNQLNQSSWGPVKFGGLIPIPEMVKEVIEKISPTKSST